MGKKESGWFFTTVANGWGCVNAQSWHLGGSQPLPHTGRASWGAARRAPTPCGSCMGGLLLHPTSSQVWGLPGLPCRAVSPGLAMSPTTGLCLVLCVQHGALPLAQAGAWWSAVGAVADTANPAVPRCFSAVCSPQRQQCPQLCFPPPGNHKAQGMCPPSPPWASHQHGASWQAKCSEEALGGGVGQHPAPLCRVHGGGRCSRCARYCCLYRQVVRERCPARAPAFTVTPSPALPAPACSSGQGVGRGRGHWPGLWAPAETVGFCRDCGR